MKQVKHWILGSLFLCFCLSVEAKVSMPLAESVSIEARQDGGESPICGISIYFSPGKAEYIEPGQYKELARLLKQVAAYPDADIMITGWADKTGSSEANERISLRRAETLKRYLVRKGIAEERITIKGSGVDAEATENRLARRAEVGGKKEVAATPQPKKEEPKAVKEEVKQPVAEPVKEEQQVLIEEVAEQPEVKTETAEISPCKAPALFLRANLLRWATLTPDLGIEWRIGKAQKVGILVNGSWTSWCWNDKDRKYALKRISPEVRYYIGKENRWFVGAEYHIGDFNYKLGKTGKQGNEQGGGITGGYLWKLNRSLSLDLHLGLGYTYADYDEYFVQNKVRVYQDSKTKNYWGLTQVGVTLVWDIFRTSK